MADHRRKRARLAEPAPPTSRIEARLSEELICLSLSYLDCDDLARCSRLSSHWNRLANEPSLWRSLFLRKFAPKSKRRAALPTAPRSRTWKELFKIQTRWLDGKARSTAISLRSRVLEQPPQDLDLQAEPETTPNTIVRFSGQHVYAASRSPSFACVLPAVTVHLHQSAGSQPVAELFPASLSTKDALSITELTLDEGKAGRIAVFYSNGQFAIFDLLEAGGWQEIFAGVKKGKSIALARLRSPLLVTCTSDFCVTFTSITEPKPGSSRLSLRKVAAPMRTPLCWSPLVMSLRCVNAEKKQFRVNIAHSAPHFPGSWTVALHEFDVDLSAAFGERVLARQVTASPTSSSPITALEYRPPWLVASRADNTLDVFLARSSPPSERSQLSLEHRRTLFGHTAAVHTVSLGEGGRCVSGGNDGRVKVWALSEPHTQAITVHSEELDKPMPPPPSVSWLGFDEEKIVVLRRSPQRATKREREEEAEDIRVLSFD